VCDEEQILLANRCSSITLLVIALRTLMPTIAALGQEYRAGMAVPDTALNVRADVPPPLRFDQKPEEPPPVQPRGNTHRWQSYASGMHLRTEALLKSLDRKLTSPDRRLDLTFELWIGPEGRVTRAQIVEPSDDSTFDAMLRNKLLAELALPSPSKEMPMLVKLRLAHQRYD
jgi:hypothetical protein